jgi:hypothetical protein
VLCGESWRSSNFAGICPNLYRSFSSLDWPLMCWSKIAVNADLKLPRQGQGHHRWHSYYLAPVNLWVVNSAQWGQKHRQYPNGPIKRPIAGSKNELPSRTLRPSETRKSICSAASTISIHSSSSWLTEQVSLSGESHPPAIATVYPRHRLNGTNCVTARGIRRGRRSVAIEVARL